MHETDIKKLKFCRWMPWAGRPVCCRTTVRVGVYLWVFHRAPSSSANPYPKLPRQVIYIGEAKNIDRRPLTGGTIDSFITGIPFRRSESPDAIRLPLSRTPVRSWLGQKRPEVSYSRLRVYTQGSRHRCTGSYTKMYGRPPRCITRRHLRHE